MLGDRRLLGGMGAEVLVETARLWADLGFYGTDGKFHIHAVTGPDEYTTVVNDNSYTNLMARLNLNFAAATRALDARRAARRTTPRWSTTVGLQPDEVESWERAAAAMHVPFDTNAGIHPQYDTFLDREIWDLDSTPPEKFPLLLHYHPLVIYRHQVLKQADIVLAMFLLGNEFSRGAEAPQLRLLRPAHHRRLVLVGVRAEHHRRRDRQVSARPWSTSSTRC